MNALRGELWDDGAIIPPSELPEAKSPYLCLTSGQGYATFAVGRDSTGRAAGLLIWTEGRFKELPELIDTLHLDPKDLVDPFDDLPD